MWQQAAPVGFEPTRGDPIGLAGRRLSHSAKVSVIQPPRFSTLSFLVSISSKARRPSTLAKHVGRAIRPRASAKALLVARKKSRARFDREGPFWYRKARRQQDVTEKAFLAARRTSRARLGRKKPFWWRRPSTLTKHVGRTTRPHASEKHLGQALRQGPSRGQASAKHSAKHLAKHPCLSLSFPVFPCLSLSFPCLSLSLSLSFPVFAWRCLAAGPP